jgi:hypothetical protein
MMLFKNLLILSVLFFASSANAIEQTELDIIELDIIEFEINGLKVGDKLTEDFFDNYCAKRDKGKKEIECKRKQNINGVQVSVLYLFYDSSFATVSLSYKSQMYDELVKAYSRKFSHSPHKIIEEPIILRTGVEYTNEKVLWATAAGDFYIEKYGNNFERGYAHLDSHEYIKYVAKKKSERSSSNIGKIFRGLFN